ncbi:MAG: hypothetical protein ACK5HR_02160 [Mycoplasmatales bacterium]
MQTCLLQAYEDNQDMTNNEYKELLKESGECTAYKLTNGDRKDNYLDRNEQIYLEGTEQEICLNDYYSSILAQTGDSPMNVKLYSGENANNYTNCYNNKDNKGIIPPLPIPYRISLAIWIGQIGYDLWHVDKPVDDNYDAVGNEEFIKGVATDSNDLGFGNCWKTSVYPFEIDTTISEDDTCSITM